LNASAIFLQAPAYGSGGNSPGSVVVADVNGDGKLDLVVANGCVLNSQCGSLTAGILGVLLGNGDGSFQSPLTYFSGSTKVYSVAVADVNGDGKPDLLVGGACPNGDCMAGGTVSVLLGNGDGTFQAGVNYSAAPSGSGTVVVADVNGDGKPDLILAGGAIGVLLGNGNGTFQAEVSYSGGGTAADSVAVSDVNGDGKLDLIVSNQFTGTGTSNGGVGILLGNGDGTFQPALTYYSGGQNAHSIAVGDINGDGRPDIVAVNDYMNGDTFIGGVGVLLGNGDGTFQSAVSYLSSADRTEFAVIADVNHDGKADLLISSGCEANGNTDNCASGIVSVFLGNGNGSFQAPVRYSTGEAGGYAMAAGDINGDGNLDLLITDQCSNNGCIGVLLGNTDGSFQSAHIFSSGVYPDTSVAAADVNGDGKPDLIVANLCLTHTNCASGGVGVLLGNGNGTFQAPATYGSGSFIGNSIAVADVNGDGKPDVVIAKQCIGGCAGGTIGVLLGNGNGAFQLLANYGSGGQNAYSVAVMDVNGDGKPDVLVANVCVSASNCTNGVVGVLLGNGDGTFRPAASYGSGGQYPDSIAVADVNLDGKPDVLVANYYTGNGNSTGTLGVLLGNGDGTFQSAVSYGSGGVGDNSVAVGDVNGDGKPDLLAANQCASTCANGALGVLLGNGDGTFQSAIASATPVVNSDFFEALALADFDGDGKLDVACGAGDFIVLGNGDGTFQPPLALGGGSPGIAVGDFNRDGKPDLALGGVTILLNITARNTTATTTTLQSSLNPSGFNQAVSFTATVSTQASGAAQGTVTFTDGAAVLGIVSLTNGSAVVNTSGLAAGAHSIAATYGGDSQHSSSASAPLVQTVKQATSTATISSSVNPAVFGQSIVLSTTVTPQYAGNATGTVTFNDGTTALGTATVIGNTATLSGVKPAAGSHTISASYGGDNNVLGSTSAALTLTVNRSTTTTALKSSSNPSYLNQSVTYSATVTPRNGGVVSGNVAFKEGTVALATAALSNGQAAYSTTYTATGTHSITVVYSGDGNNAGSTSAILNQTVNSLPAATTTKIATSGSPSLINKPVTFTSTVTSTYGPLPDGELVTFRTGTTFLASVPLSGGVATYTTTALKGGSQTITAAYGGDTTFKASSSTVTQVVSLYSSSTSLPTSSLNPSTYGQSVTLRAAVTSTAPAAPTGTITFKNGTTAIGSASLNTSGVATLTKTNLPAGSLSITAVYNGDSETAKSTSSPLLQTVYQTTSTTTITSSLNPSLAGQSVTFTANVTSPTTSPTGAVTFMDGGTPLQTVSLAERKASYSTANLTVGSHSITAVYNGTPNITGSTTSVVVQSVN